MSERLPDPDRSLNIAVVGSGISGLSCAWLLAKKHRVTLIEADSRIGGHSHTVDAPAADQSGATGAIAVDTGFIVYNEQTYPNLTALFAHLGVATQPTTMSFAASIDDGAFEYGGGDLKALFAQRRNLFSPRFWSMIGSILRFYRNAPRDLAACERDGISLGDYLAAKRYSAGFIEDHILPMAAAIWSAPGAALRRYPAASFTKFCQNHGLMQVLNRPRWRTVVGGSRAYVARLLDGIGERVWTDMPVRSVAPAADHVDLTFADGSSARFDQVVLATHADISLRLIRHPTAAETELLGRFAYQKNRAVLHTDPALMPKRRAVWSAWNYRAQRRGAETELSVTYWMNALQSLDPATPLFVSLNPPADAAGRLDQAADRVLRDLDYEHPLFDADAMAAQRRLWSLQGRRRVWFCGAYFGAGFHEDGLQSGLAVAEALGGVRRPWSVPDESGRITIAQPAVPVDADLAA